MNPNPSSPAQRTQAIFAEVYARLKSMATHHLAAVGPAARVIELRYFAGLTSEQAADALGISKRTADRDWTFALAFLKSELDG